MNWMSMPEPLGRGVWLRSLRGADLPEAMELSAQAGWNQTTGDWQMLLELEPEGCLVVEADGRVAATATLVCYGTRLAWVGMVLTLPKYQRRGFARRLLAQLLARADALGIATVMLDATEQGLPLYESLGFRASQPVERWSRAGTVPGEFVTNISEPEAAWWKYDKSAFGADRSRLLQLLASRSSPYLGTKGYLLSRPGRVSHYLGPCVAASCAEAEEMIEPRLRSQGASSWMWDLLPRNREAVAIAVAFGFSPARRLMRMTRGCVVQESTAHIYAIAGFELG